VANTTAGEVLGVRNEGNEAVAIVGLGGQQAVLTSVKREGAPR
jgi:hypothetical protein